MIFYIDASVWNKAEAGALSDVEVEGLSALARAFRAGKHLIFGDRAAIIGLRDSAVLNAVDKKVFAGIAARYSFLAGDIAGFKFIARVVCEESISRVTATDHVELRIPLSFVGSTDVASEPGVVFEDIEDSMIYEAICRKAMSEIGIPHLALGIRAINGGGNRTATVFYREVSLGRGLNICVVDSDRKCPGQAIGDTAQAVVDRAAELTVLADFKVIDVHEVENLIPPEVYRSELSGCADVQRALSGVEQVKSSGKGEAYLYFDYKKGISAGLINSCVYTEAYWGQVASCNKACKKPKSCTCYRIEPVGNRPEIAAWRRAVSVMPPTSDDKLNEVWGDIASFILSWCIALPRQHAI